MVPDPQQTMNSATTKSGRNFTMVFIDLDDTLIPTTIRNSIRINFGFELFRIMDTNPLQSDITNALHKIKRIMNKYRSNDSVRFALVSNASHHWISDMICSENAKFPILGKYLRENNIETVSAIEAASKYLKNEFGQNAKQIYDNNRFMYKYTTFRMLIHKYSNLLSSSCSRVISIGDGEHEQKAMRVFAQRNKDIIAINIRLRKAPTLTQLQSEWKYINTCFDGVISSIIDKSDATKHLDANNYVEIDIDRKFKHDNNALCTGKYQLNAINLYFNVFMKMLQRDTKETQKKAMEAVCKIIHSNLVKNNDASSPRHIQLKEMLRIAVKNQQFHESISKMMMKKKSISVPSK